MDSRAKSGEFKRRIRVARKGDVDAMVGWRSSDEEASHGQQGFSSRERKWARGI
jgi:hypothetical protein